MIFALVGNQNCGKTTLFNALTGSNQHVGNFPGVTVDQKTGEIRGEKGCSVVDLPGIYSLRPYTQEEIVSRDYILQQKPDGIINIVDATNIERNLYLTLQLLELRVPMVLALNMMDEVRANGGTVDVQKMSRTLGIPVVPISAAKGEGVSELVDQALSVARGHVLPKVTDFCADDSAVHRCIHAVVHLIADHADRMGVPARFCAAKLIEGGDDLADRLALDQNREVFAVPGPADAPMSAGTNGLIARGEAKLIRSAQDILVEYVTRYPHKVRQAPPLSREGAEARLEAAAEPAPEPVPRPAERNPLPLRPRSELEAMGDEQRAIFALLSGRALVPDEIVGRTEIPARRVNTALTLLQAQGYLNELPGKRFTAAVRFDD